MSIEVQVCNKKSSTRDLLKRGKADDENADIFVVACEKNEIN